MSAYTVAYETKQTHNNVLSAYLSFYHFFYHKNFLHCYLLSQIIYFPLEIIILLIIILTEFATSDYNNNNNKNS